MCYTCRVFIDIASHVSLTLRTNVIFTRFSTDSFIPCFFILGSNQASISPRCRHVIVLCCVVWTMLNCPYGPSAYLTKNKVVVELFLRYQRLPRIEHQHLSTTIVQSTQVATVGCYRLLSINIHRGVAHSITHTNALYKVDVRLKYSMVYTPPIFTQLAHARQLFVKKSYTKFREIRQKVLSPHNTPFQARPKNCEKRPLGSPCPSVRPSA